MPTVALQPKTYATEDISATSPVVRCYFPQDGLHYAAAEHEQRMVAVANGWPRPLSAQPVAKVIVLDCRPQLTGDTDPDAAIQAFKAIFDPAEGERTLVVTDGTTDWEMDCSVVRMAAQNNTGNHWLVTLQATFGLWRDTGDRTDETAISAVTSAALALTTLGNQKTPPQIEVTPTAVKGVGNDQRYALQAVIAWRAPGAGLNYPIAIQMDTATEVTATRMQADGDDLRVIVDNVEVQRDLGSMNAATTNVWFAADWAPARSATIKSAMTAGSPATGADWDLGALADTSQLPDGGVLLIGTEAIHYTSKDADGHSLVNVTRGVRNTTAASHSVADVASYVEHDIQVIYGYTAATAPTTDTERSPAFDPIPASSDNDQWTYNSSGGWVTDAGTRPGEWRADILDAVRSPLLVAGRSKYAAAFSTAVPTGVGADDTGGTATGAATKWQCVDDAVGAPNDDTDYVDLTTAVDFSVVTSASVPRGSVLQVTVKARVKANGASATARLKAYVAGSGFVGTTTAVSNGSYAEITHTWSLNPQNITEERMWSPDDVANMEIGFEVVAMGAATSVRVTQLYVQFDGALHSDPSASLGIYYAPNAPLPGLPNRDAWVLDQPVGIVGNNSVQYTYLGDPNSGTVSRSFFAKGRGFDGVLRQVYEETSALSAGASRSRVTAPYGPLNQLVLQVDQAAAVPLDTQFDGVGLTAVTVKLDLDFIPTVVVGSRQEAYVHRWALNQEDDDTALEVLFVGFLDKTLTLDCEDGAITYEDAGRTCMSALSLNTRRRDWLLLEVGGNALTWSDAVNGSGVLGLVLRWRDRRN